MDGMTIGWMNLELVLLVSYSALRHTKALNQIFLSGWGLHLFTITYSSSGYNYPKKWRLYVFYTVGLSISYNGCMCIFVSSFGMHDNLFDWQVNLFMDYVVAIFAFPHSACFGWEICFVTGWLFIKWIHCERRPRVMNSVFKS